METRIIVCLIVAGISAFMTLFICAVVILRDLKWEAKEYNEEHDLP